MSNQYLVSSFSDGRQAIVTAQDHVYAAHVALHQWFGSKGDMIQGIQVQRVDAMTAGSHHISGIRWWPEPDDKETFVWKVAVTRLDLR